MRISAWSHNTVQDFQAMHNFLSNNLSLRNTTTEQIKHQLLLMWTHQERLFSVLKPEGFFLRGERLRHHLIFYFGHTPAFYINKLVTGKFIDFKQRIDPHFESIFAVGVDEMSWDDIAPDNYDWNGLKTEEEFEAYIAKVMDYRKKVLKFLLKMLDDYPLNKGRTDPIAESSLHWVILMGIEHEKIHLETSACIVAQLPMKYLKRDSMWKFPLS